jgi:hypothetical protein
MTNADLDYLDTALIDELFVLPETAAHPLNAEKFSVVSNPRCTILVFNIADEMAELELLAKILKAVDLDINTHINLLQFNATAEFSTDLLQTYAAPKYLFFGLSPKNIEMQMDWKTYKIYDFRAAKYLLAHSLKDISAKPDLKKTLWLAMQPFFLEK